MKIKILPLIAVFLAVYTNAQVGVGTDNPLVTLDINSKPSDLNLPDGIKLPSLTGDELHLKRNAYTQLQHSTIVYVTTAATTPEGSTINLTSPGYYYYDHSLNNPAGIWIKLNKEQLVDTNSWNVQGTTNKAIANTDNIYQKGKVAIGFDSTNLESDAQLEVKGIVYATHKNDIGQKTQFLIGEGMANISVSKSEDSPFKSSLLDMNQNRIIFNNSDVNSNSQLILNKVNSNESNYSQVKLSSSMEDEINTLDITAGQFDSADLYPGGIKIKTKTAVKDRGIYIQPDYGIRFLNNKDSGGGSYEFPTVNGTLNQVLTTDGNTQDAKLSWKNISDLSQNNWKIQNTTNSATLNTDNIYQKGKVAIGFDSTNLESDAQLEVKGKVLATDINSTTGQIATLSVGNGATQIISQEFANPYQGKYTGFLASKDNVTLGTYHGNGSNRISSQSDISQGIQRQVNQGNNEYHFARLYTSKNNEVNQLLLTSNELGDAKALPGGIKITSNKDQSTKGIFIDYDKGVRFTNNRSFSTSGSTSSIEGSSYIFPTNNGLANQVLTTDGNTQDATLTWKNISDLIPSAPSTPRYYYFPSLSLPTNNRVDANSRAVTYNQADVSFQVDLFEVLKNQIENPIASSNTTSNGLSDLILDRDKYEYFVIQANQQVFKNISFLNGNGNEGKLVYKVDTNVPANDIEMMNVIIKLK